jgi:hypothetical protein
MFGVAIRRRLCRLYLIVQKYAYFRVRADFPRSVSRLPATYAIVEIGTATIYQYSRFRDNLMIVSKDVLAFVF